MLELRPADINYLQLLAPLTNIIPVIAQADTMTPEAIVQCKSQIRSKLKEAGIHPFSFKDEDWPYAVSSLSGSDHDIMDASVLMSPDYQQPLVASELACLTEHMFCENGASWLKYAAAQKYLQWQRYRNASRPRALYGPLIVSDGAQTTDSSMIAMGLHSYSQTGLVDWQQQEFLACVHFGHWPSDLRRSLNKERAKVRATTRVLERLSEGARKGRIVAVRRHTKHRASDMSEKGNGAESRKRREASTELHQDPLGLFQLTVILKAMVSRAIGVGVLGILAITVKQGWHEPVFRWFLH